MKISVNELLEVLNVSSNTATTTEQIVDTAKIFFDSRKTEAGGIFVALKTSQNDGAKYIKSAFEQGAVLAISGSNPDNLENVLIVDDALKAFQDLGRYVRSKYTGVVIGITGSSGKTTTKAETVQMLSAFGGVYAGDPSFNNHIGTPYNLCKLDFNAKYAIVEMGMDHTGEIAHLVDMVRPNISAITNVYPMHIEYFKCFKDIAYAKSEIFIPIKGGKAIINADTNFADEVLIPEAKKYGASEIITFGKAGDVKLKSVSFTKEGKTAIEIEIDGVCYKHLDKALGERFAYNACFVLALAKILNLDINAALKAIANFDIPKGRGKVSRIKLDDKRTITLIDDSYNGQPEAMRQSIKTLGLMQRAGKKIALLGKMSELGDHSEAEHHAVGKTVAATDIDLVIAIGAPAKDILAELPSTKQTIYRDTIDGLADELVNNILEDGDIILIKGSHYGSRVFEVSEALLKL